MGKLDTDYLWLHEEQPRSRSRLRRVALILVIPLIGGTAWLTASPQSELLADNQARQSHANAQARSDSAITTADVDISIGPGGADVAQLDPSASDKLQPGTAVTDLAQNAAASDDLALSESGATSVAIRTLTLSDEQTSTVRDDAPGTTSPDAQANSELIDAVDQAQNAGTAAPHKPDSPWAEVTIRRGDTLSIAFSRNNLSYGDSLKIAHMDEHGKRFTRGLRAGDTMQVKADADGGVLALDFPIDALHTLKVRPDGNGFSAEMALTDVEHRQAYATGMIGTSFYVDALESGLSDRQIMKLVKIFGWDVDFAFDIRPGDRFVVVYDELYKDGDKVADGEILAASFVNRGREVRAIRFAEAGEGQGTMYYSPAGRAMKKAFIRTPVDYTRISSGFNLSRSHPILNRIRRHEGTDYAAPTGTPIKATGNGRIVFRGRRGGYGNMIVIRHDSHLSTRYGHMSGFKKKLGVGSKVRQGDVIGYVGMTGLATGPHLHYEFRVDGNPKDPERVALPKALPLPGKYMPDFRKHAAPLLAQLDSLTRIEVARADTGGDTSN